MKPEQTWVPWSPAQYLSQPGIPKQNWDILKTSDLTVNRYPEAKQGESEVPGPATHIRPMQPVHRGCNLVFEMQFNDIEYNF